MHKVSVKASARDKTGVFLRGVLTGLARQKRSRAIGCAVCAQVEEYGGRLKLEARRGASFVTEIYLPNAGGTQ